MDRRQLLKGAAALLAGPAVAAEGQPFRVGHATTTHLHYEKTTASFWKGVEELSALGFRGTEADDMIAHLSDVYANRVAEFRERMAKHSMTLPALYHTVPEDFAARDRKTLIASLMKVGKFIHDVGGGIFNLSGPDPVPKSDRAPQIRALAEVANELGKRLREEYGLRAGYHPEGDGLLRGREDISRLMDLTRPEVFSFCPDTGHLTDLKCDVLEVFRTYRSRIIHMHAKDYDPNLVTPETATTGRKGGFVVLGHGVVNFPAVVEFLKKSDYRAWFMIELDPPRSTPLQDSRGNLAYVTQKLKLTVG